MARRTGDKGLGQEGENALKDNKRTAARRGRTCDFVGSEGARRRRQRPGWYKGV